MKVNAKGTRTVSREADLVGTDGTFQMSGLPVGDVVFSASLS